MQGKMGDLNRRLLFLLGALIVYRVGAHIPVPGIDPVALAELFKSQRGGILDMFNMFSGGALSRFTILALGIMPYISASIIMQLMTVVSPTLEALKKEGEAGRRKITQYTRYGTAALAMFQGLGIAIALESQRGLVLEPGLAFRLTTMITLVTGTMFLMWLGEQVTERGIGNGISMLIFAGIVAGLPGAIAHTLELASRGAAVLHPRAVEIARNYGVPLVVRSSWSEHPGTRLTSGSRRPIGSEGLELGKPVDAAELEEGQTVLALSHVPDRPGVAARLFEALAQAGLKETEPLATQLLMLMDGVFVSTQMHSHHEAAARLGRMAAEALIDAALRAQGSTDAGEPTAG